MADVLSRRSDLLVLKYAQYPFGADNAVAGAMGLRSELMPGVGADLLVTGKPPVPATRVLFLGAPPIESFDYRAVRQIGQRALAVPARELPHLEEVCLTLHGVGFGLDEAEAFESEVAGIIDAVVAGTYPRSLSVVTFLERHEGRANRMRELLRRLLPDLRILTDRPLGPAAVDASSAERLRSVGYDSGAKGHVFVAMPFQPSFDDVFYYGIAPPIRTAGLLCERMDKVVFTGDIVLQMKDRIGRAQFVVADLTGANPNVYLEVGYAWGREIPAVLLCDKSQELQFDVRGHRCILYSSIRDLEAQLKAEIPGLLADS